MLGDSIIETPSTFWMELVLLDAFHAKVCLTYHREYIPNGLSICRLSAFLLFAYNLFTHVLLSVLWRLICLFVKCLIYNCLRVCLLHPNTYLLYFVSKNESYEVLQGYHISISITL
nr:MAG TPA: hypothetical protein [Caudoviricetes sp.]